MWHAADGMGWWMLWGGFMMVVFWGAIIALIVWAINSTIRRGDSRNNSAQSGDAKHTPLDIAKQRYASGEIDRDEFQRIKEDLAET